MGADNSTLKAAGNNAQLKSERFELASDDFTLDKEALKKYFKCSDKECQVLFDHFDMDGNGKIDSYEFVCAMTMLSHATLEEKAELIFNLYDFDGSKFISRDELVILMTNALTALKSMQKQQPPSIQEIEVKTDEFFKKSDIDGDKKITLQEFKNYIAKDKQILEVLINTNVAKKEDLGMDFGTGVSAAPDIDKDLEAECNPKELSDKKQNIKDGVDYVKKQNADGMFEEVGMDSGDQFMAVKPWKGVVDNSIPSNYKPNKRDGEAPDATLQLEHVYGYRCHDVRNNLRYTANGQLVYFAAAVGVVLNPQTNTQKFVIEHNDDIHSIALHPNGKYVATGQIGKNPWLIVWDNESMQVLARFQGTLQKGIMHLAFSNDGKFLVASAMDDDHSIAIYEWEAKAKPGVTIKPIFGKGTRANILSLGFNPTGDKIVATCVKELSFFTFAGGVIKNQKGTGWPNSLAESVLSQAFIDNTLYTGTFTGNIIQWSDRSIVGKPLKAHAEGCNALFTRKSKKGLISGGNDGLIICWILQGAGLVQEKQFDLKAQEVRSLIPKARSVCENSTNGNILVGTRGGEIVEFGGPKAVVHMRSHCDGELWGLTPHPSKAEFITIGQDNMLAIWDIQTRRQKKFARLDCAGNVLAYSHDGARLAIGYINGSLTVLDANFQVQVIRKDRKEAIQEIKFSPDSTICAVGAHDSMIFTYNAQDNFKPMKKLRGHHSTITHFDFSLDGRYLMSNCTSYEILFFDLLSGKQVTGGASQLKDEPWNTWTCTLGWPVQGIFPPCADGSDINACDRAPDRSVIATGDDFGMVKLFKFPNPIEKASYNQYVGHSSHVTNVRFIPKSPYLISTGGEDKTIFQWKYNLDKESQAESKNMNKAKMDTESLQQDMGDDFGFEEEGMGEGDQRLAVLPFKGEVDNSVPTGFKPTKDMANPPDGNLRLKYAHGFRSFDTRGNLKFIKSGEVAFTTAALGVILNKQKNTQKFFNLHQDDVVAMALHPSKDIIATGQMAAKGKAKVIDIFVWNASTQQNLAQINGFHRRAVRNLAFSPNGDKLLSIGEDDFHSVAIYDWANKRMLCNAKVDPDKVFDAMWKDDTEFMTVGMKHVKFFTVQGQNLTPNKGLYGALGPTPMICCNYVFDTKVAVTGTPTGDLIVWSGRTIGKAQKGHTDALWQIVQLPGNQIVTGSNDGKLIFWDKGFAQKKMIDLNPMSKFQPGIRALDYDDVGKTIIIGTRGSEIIEIDANSGKKLNTLIYGHFEGTKQAELWGCTVHPKLQQFATCGADSTVRIWEESTMLRASDPFTNDLTAIDWASTGNFLVVGDRNCYIYTVDAESLKQLGVHKGGNADTKNAWIQDIKISPNAQLIAFGSHGGRSKVDLVKVLDGGKKLQLVKQVDIKVSSSITHLDWSLDSNTIVVNSQAYELMWLDVRSYQRVFASGAKDIDFATWTCILGFSVQGIWPGPDFTDVNSTCRSNSRQILATADDFGMVKLFKYPCVQERAGFKEFGGHSSHVTRVKFSYNDKYVLSVGGNDKTLIVWETDFAMDDPNSQMNNQQEEMKVSYGSIADDEDFVESRVDKSRIQKQQKKEELKQAKKPQIQQEDDLFEIHDAGEGDEFMAVKPWIGQMKEPTGFQKAPINQEQAPAIKMELEWVHGYRSRDTKNNISTLLDGSIAYHAAGLGICYDPSENTQRFFNLHTDDVTAIAFSSDKRMIATGETGRKPAIYIWDGISMQQTFKLWGKLQNGIQGLAFSPSGKILAAVGMDDNHSVAVYNAETGAFVAMTNGDKAQILELAFKNETEFASAGVKHFMNWKVGATLASTRGNFAKFDPRIGSCRFSGDNCLTGSITGELYIWGGPSIKTAKKLHEKPLDAICCTANYILTGGRDQKVNILQASTQNLLFTFAVDEIQFKSISGGVRALCLNDAGNQLLIGTFGSEIYQVQIDMNKKAIGAPKVITQGHYSPCRKDNNEVWGLVSFPRKELYVTVSDDCTLRVWDAPTRKQIRLVKLTLDAQGNELPLDPATQEFSNAAKGRVADVSPDEKYCAVGFRDGSFRIYDILKDWAFSAKKIPSQGREISDVKFSPDGKLLAVSSHDCKVYVFNFPALTPKCTLKASSSTVTHLDWSLDGRAIHTNDTSYEILYYNVDTGQQNTGGASGYKDELWQTWTLVLGWPVQGIWPPGVDGTDINATDRSRQPHRDGYHLIATADDFSKVKIFRYPSIKENSAAIEGRGHSSHVTQVKWSKDDKWLYSAGGNDTCIFQWKIEK